MDAAWIILLEAKVSLFFKLSYHEKHLFEIKEIKIRNNPVRIDIQEALDAPASTKSLVCRDFYS
jgi:hypothetical protein